MPETTGITRFMFIKDQDSHLKTKKGIFDQIIEWVSPFRREKDAGDTALSPHLPDGKTFAEFHLSEEILKGIEDAGFTRCTPIQELALPITLAGEDIAAQAQTGTGKTAAFLITLFQRLLQKGKRKPGIPSALILAPTRELALQIYQDGQVLGKYTGLKMVAVFGGIDYHKQATQLREGVDVVIATPGRLIDYMKQKAFIPERIKILVVDEADRMFDMGFIKDLRYILRRLPSYDQRQSMLFSATLSSRVLELTYEYMNLPKEIYVTPDEITVETVEQFLFHVAKHEKLPLLLGVLKKEPWERVLIFANTKATVEWLSAKLKGNGYPVKGLSGNLNQRQRLKIINHFKSGDLKILVATDVASRGLHVEEISHVINYDLPQDREDYIHRIGRTARAGMSGKAISLACEEYVYSLEAIEEYIGEKIPVLWPDEEWFLADRSREHRRADRRQTGQRRKGSPPRKGRSGQRSGVRSRQRSAGGTPPKKQSRSKSPQSAKRRKPEVGGQKSEVR
jgi:ATP-dependent RNA helicase RhlB